ncbi:MAG: putative quinone oxidoreductase YhfP [marine bacterium B5-7]|nr:MAG: putative quinone oxidoreductase YhfP [marine bacterium B5-7]
MTIDDLTVGDVVIRVHYSGVNYKDALAATGKGRILRKYPLNGGIDLSGTVVSSTTDRFREGQQVLVVGCGLSEIRDGGFAEYARVPENCVVPLPAGLTLFEAMAIGTAGFTAALAVIRMEQLGQQPSLGPVVVTGATGGVGSIAIDLLSSRGYEVYAITGKTDQRAYLESIGAADIIDRMSLDASDKPLERAQYGGAVDNVGGEMLAWLTRRIQPFGNIASVGLAGGHELHTTVMPFILRGVSLIGINSIEMPDSLRDLAWQQLGGEMRPRHLDQIVSRVIDFDQLIEVFDDYIQGSVTGRTVVRLHASD